MIWIFLIAFVIVMCIYLIRQDKKINTSEPQQAYVSKQEKSVMYKIPRDRLLKLLGWEDSARAQFIGEYQPEIANINGYTIKPLVGTFAREDVTIFDTGYFNGFAMIEPQNEYDSTAVVIWRDDQKKLGYIPKGNTELFNYIARQGGVVHVFGVLGYDCWADKWKGSVAVECNCENMENRNAYIKADWTFYEPTMDLIAFIEEQQNK